MFILWSLTIKMLILRIFPNTERKLITTSSQARACVACRCIGVCIAKCISNEYIFYTNHYILVLCASVSMFTCLLCMLIYVCVCAIVRLRKMWYTMVTSLQDSFSRFQVQNVIIESLLINISCNFLFYIYNF